MQGVRFERTYSCETGLLTGSFVMNEDLESSAGGDLRRVSEEFDQAWLSLHM